MKKLLILLILTFAIILPNVSSQGIMGVSPGNYLYDNVLRGGYAERSFTLSYSGEDPVDISIQPWIISFLADDLEMLGFRRGGWQRIQSRDFSLPLPSPSSSL